jgi:hypothetical protein
MDDRHAWSSDFRVMLHAVTTTVANKSTTSWRTSGCFFSLSHRNEKREGGSGSVTTGTCSYQLINKLISSTQLATWRLPPIFHQPDARVSHADVARVSSV